MILIITLSHCFKLSINTGSAIGNINMHKKYVPNTCTSSYKEFGALIKGPAWSLHSQNPQLDDLCASVEKPQTVVGENNWGHSQMQ